METEQRTSGLVNLVLQAIAVAMAIAVIVLNILHAAPPETQAIMLGIGLFALATTSLSKGGTK